MTEPYCNDTIASLSDFNNNLQPYQCDVKPKKKFIANMLQNKASMSRLALQCDAESCFEQKTPARVAPLPHLSLHSMHASVILIRALTAQIYLVPPTLPLLLLLLLLPPPP